MAVFNKYASFARQLASFMAADRRDYMIKRAKEDEGEPGFLGRLFGRKEPQRKRNGDYVGASGFTFKMPANNNQDIPVPYLMKENVPIPMGSYNKGQRKNMETAMKKLQKGNAWWKSWDRTKQVLGAMVPEVRSPFGVDKDMGEVKLRTPITWDEKGMDKKESLNKQAAIDNMYASMLKEARGVGTHGPTTAPDRYIGDAAYNKDRADYEKYLKDQGVGYFERQKRLLEFRNRAAKGVTGRNSGPAHRRYRTYNITTPGRYWEPQQATQPAPAPVKIEETPTAKQVTTQGTNVKQDPGVGPDIYNPRGVFTPGDASQVIMEEAAGMTDGGPTPAQKHWAAEQANKNVDLSSVGPDGVVDMIPEEYADDYKDYPNARNMRYHQFVEDRNSAQPEQPINIANSRHRVTKDTVNRNAEYNRSPLGMTINTLKNLDFSKFPWEQNQ